MQLTLKYFAILREQRGLNAESIETDARTPRAVYAELKSLHPLTLNENQLRIAVNDEFVPLDTELSHGDTLVFIPPVAGG